MTYAIGFYIFTAGLYLTLLAGIILLFHTYLNTSRLYRGQTGVILIAIIVPTLGNLIGVVGLNPIPFTYLVVMICHRCGRSDILGHFLVRALRHAPLAIIKVIECMKEGAIVIDRKGRVAHMNPSALEMFDEKRDTIGCSGEGHRPVPGLDVPWPLSKTR